MKSTFKHILGSYAFALLTLPALLTACSDNDDVPDVTAPAKGREIRFSATTEYPRSGDITTNNLTAFNVYSYTSDGSTFMDNVAVTKGDNNLWSYSPVQYWPSDGSLQFYAYAPAGWLGNASPLSAVTYDNAAANTDLVYAVSPQLQGNTAGGNAQIVFNFRHALAKINIRMASSDANLRVQVSNVAMANIATKGNFTFPRQSTSGSASAENTGSWSGQTAKYPIVWHVSQSNSELITLTDTPIDITSDGNGFGYGKYMLPQTLTYRSGGNGLQDTYLTVMCSVYDATTGTKLWPNANTPEENVVQGSAFGDGLLKYPLGSTAFSAWQPGYNYIYNIVINANDEMSPIEFGNPTVEGYVDISTSYE